MNNSYQLLAGAGKAEIQFSETLFPMEGFQGVHDAPAVRVLLLQCREQVALVCTELVMLPPEVNASVKEKISEITNTKCENIWVHTTHAITTPHAPHAPMGMGGVPVELNEDEKKNLSVKLELYTTALMTAVAQAAEDAAGSFCAARMGVNSGPCHVNVNRDVKTPYGWWIGFAPDGPSNHTATVLSFEDENGKQIANLISYGIKPCAIDNSEIEKGTRLVSADVPGLACRLLEVEFDAPCLFAMSAAGDQVPLEQAWYDEVTEDGFVQKVDLGVREGLRIVDRLGQQMAHEIAPIIRSSSCNQREPVIKTGKSSIVWPGKGRAKMQVTHNAEYKQQGNQQVDAQVIVIGDVALVGLKPEVNCATEAELQAASPYAHTLVISMVNGGQKYMPEHQAYVNGTWEAQSAPFMPGAAECWVEEAGKLLIKMSREDA